MPLPDVAGLFRLDDRVAIVTGGSRGLGAAIARGFAAAGAAVVVSSRTLEASDAVAEAIRSDGGDALAVAAHMGDLDQVGGLVEQTVDAYGRIDCVVNNAAIGLRFGIGAFDPGAWHKVLAVNLTGPLALVHAALPCLRASLTGTVVNVVSIGGIRGAQSALGYGSTKAALRHATESMAAELAPDGIRVNALAPGPFATDMLQGGGDEFVAAASANTLMGRVAEPDEIVGAALFLASPASSFVTGSVLVVDGGALA